MDKEQLLKISESPLAKSEIVNSFISPIDGFVYLSSSLEKSDAESSEFSYELIESYAIPIAPDTDWVKISTKCKIYSNQRIKKMLETGLIPYNRKHWNKTVISGIPNELRGDIWIYFVQPKNSLVREKYSKWVNEPRKNEVDQNIEKDIKRTFASLPEFTEKQQLRLFNILKAYSRYDPEVGYCQGMSYIAAILILHIIDEITAFCVLEEIMSGFKWRELYVQGMPKLLSLVATLKDKVKLHLPNLYNHIETNGVYFEGLFSPMFMTLFMSCAPLSLAVRIFDLFLVEGEDIILQCIINILELMQEQIMKFKREAVHLFIKSDMIKECYEKFNFATIANLHMNIV